MKSPSPTRPNGRTVRTLVRQSSFTELLIARERADRSEAGGPAKTVADLTLGRAFPRDEPS